MIKVLIADDEPLARENLILRLEKIKGFQVCGQADNGHDTLLLSYRIKPDVVFLDINMPGLNGIEAAKKLKKSQETLVVFITAYSEFALEAFQLNALDYLVKPINNDHFENTIKQIKKQVPQNKKILEPSSQNHGFLNRLGIKNGRIVNMVDTRGIESIESDGDYLSIYVGDKKYFHNQTLKSLMPLLNPKYFLQIHRSFAINLSFLDRVVDDKKYLHVELKSGKNIPISRRLRKSVLDRIITN